VLDDLGQRWLTADPQRKVELARQTFAEIRVRDRTIVQVKLLDDAASWTTTSRSGETRLPYPLVATARLGRGERISADTI
jgi:hypothetical protein